MESGAIYEEKITSKWIVAILICATGSMLFLLCYQVLVVPIGTPTVLTWIYLIMFLLFLGLTFVSPQASFWLDYTGAALHEQVVHYNHLSQKDQ